jgi:protein-disulfide isomerase
MAMRAISALILGTFALSGSTCGKSTEDPSKEKSAADSAPVVVLDGIDTNQLTQREKRDWSTYVSEMMSPCPSVPVSLAQCVKEKRACDRCAPAAKFMVKLVKDGYSREQIEKTYKNRFDPEKVKDIPVDGSPTKGSEVAPITMVEFADFQCPHCGQYAPMIDKLVESRKNDVRLIYKFFVLGKFPNSENAARAAIAAGKQGKFWEMHHLIFSNQENLSQQGLDTMAKQIGLDVTRLHADMQAPETADRIARDRKLADDLMVIGTPTIYINGRQFDGLQDMNDWLDLELKLNDGKSPPPPAASADAGAKHAGAPSLAASGSAAKR